MVATCAHLGAITALKTVQRHECEECVKSGSRCAHLRACQSCGSTRCCDSSPNRHASKGRPVSKNRNRNHII